MTVLRRIAGALAASACLIASTNAFAAVTYLDCTVVDSRGDNMRFTVGLDEAIGKATHSDGKQDFTAPAIFAMDTITYKIAQSTGGSMLVTRQYSISRTDLSVIHLFRAEVTDQSLRIAPKESTMNGTCTKATPKKRQI